MIFDAKYYNAESKTVTDPELPGNATAEVRKAAVAIFKAVDGYGLSRVDFFVKEDGEVVFNEINTMPGLQPSVCIQCFGKQEASTKRN